MSLPASSAAANTATVNLSGGAVQVHGLTLKQTRACRDSDENEADVLCIAWGTDSTADETRAWLETASVADTQALLRAIMELSGLDGAAKFPK